MKSISLFAIALILAFSSCSKKAEYQHEAADTIGTHGAVHRDHEPTAFRAKCGSGLKVNTVSWNKL